MRDKKFLISSIKMDLHRVVAAAGDISKELPMESVIEFLKHANADFEKLDLTEREKTLQQELQHLQNQLPQVKDPFLRLRWTEKVMTVRCRL